MHNILEMHAFKSRHLGVKEDLMKDAIELQDLVFLVFNLTLALFNQ